MTPEEHTDAATMAVAEALLQMEICGHGTRGFCKDCFWVEFSNRQPLQTQETKSRY